MPPRVVRTEPDSNAVGVHPEKIVLEFSEYVDRRSVEESIFLSPDLGALEFDWSGRELEVLFAEPLRDSVTYVLNLGTDVVDIRAGNRMASGFSLAFSTGGRIDNAWIAGRLFDGSPEGVYVFAYRLKGRDPDTLNPSRTPPDYITQTGSGGLFRLSHLADGLYRVIAVRDQYKNLLYEKQVDAFAVGRSDYRAGESGQESDVIRFRLMREDTTRPFLSSTMPGGGRQVLLRFSEPIDSLSFHSAAVEVRDTLSGVVLPVRTVYPAGPGWTELGALLSEMPEAGRAYRVSVSGITDTAGNKLDEANASLVLVGTGEPDTVLPRLELPAIADSAHGVTPAAPLWAWLTEPVDSQACISALSLRDTSGVHVELEHRWLYPTRLLLVPKPRLQSASWYRLAWVLDGLIDAEGNARADSTLVLDFMTMDPRETGEIAGRVIDEAGGSAGGPLHIRAIPLSGSGAVCSVVIPAPGSFTLREVREGRYVLEVFEDSDSSGAYSYGLPYPFVPSERFAVYPDTLRVRARWTFENAELILGR